MAGLTTNGLSTGRNGLILDARLATQFTGTGFHTILSGIKRPKDLKWTGRIFYPRPHRNDLRRSEPRIFLTSVFHTTTCSTKTTTLSRQFSLTQNSAKYIITDSGILCASD